MKKPPFIIREEMVKDPRELADRLNRIFEELYRVKADRPEYDSEQEQGGG